MTPSLLLAFVFFLLGGALGFAYGRIHRDADAIGITYAVCTCTPTDIPVGACVFVCNTCEGVRGSS